MHAETQALLDSFYQAFQQGDAETMAAYYLPEAEFSDPAFPSLNGTEAGDMWRMLVSGSGGNLQLTYRIEEATEKRGVVRWEAHYPFGPQQRPVHNQITAHIVLQDGKIIHHRDVFSFWRWSRQALGPVGLFLGWTPWLQKKVQQQAAKSLAKFRA